MNRTRSIIIALVISVAMLILLWFKETNPPLLEQTPVETLTPLEDDIIFQAWTYLNEYPLQSLIDNIETLPYIYCPQKEQSLLAGHVTHINKDGNLILTDYISNETPTRYETHINNCIFWDQPSTSTNTLGWQVMS